MTPQDAEIIRDVFAKIRAMGPAVDDAEAARAVEAELRANPAAALNLVRVVVGLERERESLAAEAEALAAELEDLRARTAPQPRGGGLFGNAPGPWGSGRAAEPAPQPGPWGAQQPSGPWGGQAQPQGGGFWGSALRTGAGVAGGLFAFEALKGMFGGGHGAEAREPERHGLFDGDVRGGERDGASEEARGGGFGGEEPERNGIIADNIDFFGGSDDDSLA